MVPKNDMDEAGIGELVDKAKEAGPLHLKWLKNPFETQLWRSIFRHKVDDQPRNRSLAVLSNVFLHLHPAKINRDAVRYTFTWGMGGITFYLFLILTFTGLAMVLFALRGMLNWEAGLSLAAGQFFGAKLGVHLQVLKGQTWVRKVLTVMIVLFAIRLLTR